MRMYGRRALLNLPGYESTGAIVAEIVQRPGYGKEPVDFWEITLKISDCSRTVDLSFCDPSDKETDDGRFENDMLKLDTLIDCLYELQKGMRRVRRLRK